MLFRGMLESTQDAQIPTFGYSSYYGRKQASEHLSVKHSFKE
jgi:hypothetical protein